jgi:hypothetical protein
VAPKGERGRATQPCDRPHARRATDRAHTHASGGTCVPGPHLVPAAAPPEPPEPPADNELGVECTRDCGADGTHQAHVRFELRAGKQKSVRDVGDGRGHLCRAIAPGIRPSLPARSLSAASCTKVNKGIEG